MTEFDRWVDTIWTPDIANKCFYNTDGIPAANPARTLCTVGQL